MRETVETLAGSVVAVGKDEIVLRKVCVAGGSLESANEQLGAVSAGLLVVDAASDVKCHGLLFRGECVVIMVNWPW